MSVIIIQLICLNLFDVLKHKLNLCVSLFFKQHFFLSYFLMRKHRAFSFEHKFFFGKLVVLKLSICYNKILYIGEFYVVIENIDCTGFVKPCR
jgi:hypothetical protein